jgi:hypothetical protein
VLLNSAESDIKEESSIPFERLQTSVKSNSSEADNKSDSEKDTEPLKIRDDPNVSEGVRTYVSAKTELFPKGRDSEKISVVTNVGVGGRWADSEK